MLSRLLLSVAVILFVCSGAFAQPPSILAGSVFQYQNFAVGDLLCPGISSSVNLVHGDGGGTSLQWLNINNEHSVPACYGPICLPCPSCDTAASQWQDAYLKQYSHAAGKCAIVSVNAFLDAGGIQEQTIGAATTPKTQAQSMGMAADQVLLRSDGAGGGSSVNYADLYQKQAGVNAAGSMLETSTIEGSQDASLGGAALSTVTLANSMTASTMQAQVVY